MWEVKYSDPNGKVDFMWYGGLVDRAEAERRCRRLEEGGMKPLSLREIKQMPGDREYLQMLSDANSGPGRYQVITYDSDGGADDKLEYDTVLLAQKAALGYIRGAEPSSVGLCYEGVIVYDKKIKRIVHEYGFFPDFARPIEQKGLASA